MSVPSTAVNTDLNATTVDNSFVCAYPLSGQYGLLQRILLYVLLLFSALVHRRIWLVAGAVATAMISSGIASVHALLLAIVTHSKDSVVDVDVFGSWAILSATLVLIWPVVHQSATLRESQFRPIFGLWILLIVIGGACGGWGISHAISAAADAPACAAPDCRPGCLSTSQLLRNNLDLVVITQETVLSYMKIQFAGCIITAILGIGFAGAALINILVDRRQTKPELEQIIADHQNRPPRSQGWQTRRYLAHIRHEHATGEFPQSRHFIARGYLNIIACPVVIALNEIYLGLSGLPVSELPYAVGQWGSWAGLILALIAAGVNHKYEPRWRKRQAILKAELDADQARQHESASTRPNDPQRGEAR